MNVYSAYSLNGPYVNPKTNREYIQIIHIVTGKRKTLQYARFLYQKHHNIILPKDIQVHHKDNNPQNNDITNLEAISKKEHERITGLNNRNYPEEKDVVCAYCKKSFTLTRQQQIERNASIRDGSGSGPFCSGKCRVTFNNLNSEKSIHARSRIELIKQDLKNKVPQWIICHNHKVSKGFVYNVKNNKLKHLK